jgi:hypothetical protein
MKRNASRCGPLAQQTAAPDGITQVAVGALSCTRGEHWMRGGDHWRQTERQLPTHHRHSNEIEADCRTAAERPAGPAPLGSVIVCACIPGCLAVVVVTGDAR